MYTSEGLSAAVSGEPLNIQHFVRYLTEKYQGIYAF
jgi:Zn-dependent M32 family carboxypeptidase